ncbi:hypothetical protein FE697_015950 [Mumia zhuanghuii]|uniref:Uncharacterized protein n=2 Tax=Mumia TaxID=1546255 RepID=A0ABW1QNT5_9ACTN|nr:MULTISPECIES: hypothetical protein [Mumia]KAA1420457.1 hypothetical protein FE697_015950 [Mumia zhuanghuii]
MSPAVVIVPVMLIIVIAAMLLVVVLAFPYRGRRVPAAMWGSERIDKALGAFAEQVGIQPDPDVAAPGTVSRERVSSGSSTPS